MLGLCWQDNDISELKGHKKLLKSMHWW